VRQFRIVICVRFRQSLYVVPWASDGLSTERWVGKSQFSWVPIGQTPLCGSTAQVCRPKRPRGAQRLCVKEAWAPRTRAGFTVTRVAEWGLRGS
jgi:hypothetical protein